jgi:hypothetical protein
MSPEAEAQRQEYAETWGFQGEEFIVTLKRKSKRLKQEYEPKTYKPTTTKNVAPVP